MPAEPASLPAVLSREAEFIRLPYTQSAKRDR